MSDGTGAVTGSGADADAGAAAQGAGRRVRVVLVDDHRMFRTGVQAEIGRTEVTGVEVVGEAADVDQAVTVITATRPRSSCSTCTCRVAAGSRCCGAARACSARPRTQSASWRSRCRTRPRT